MDELLPVLVAHVEDQDVVDLLRAVAQGHRVALVPLAEAPMDASLHVLEVHAPELPEPVLMLAEPRGLPTEDGFPLRLHPYGEAPPKRPSSFPTLDPPPEGPPAKARSTLKTNPHLSERHTADLSPESKPRDAVHSKDLEGLVLAGGKYQLERLLGSGSFGSVFKAKHRELQKVVAIKVLHPSFQNDPAFCSRFYGEALAASKLDHANIVRVFDYGQEPNGLLFIVMEYVAGESLRKALEQSKVLPLERIIDTMQQVCAGLSHAHEHALVHRDIKPDNVLLVSGHDDEGKPNITAKVCDFGIARRSVEPHVAQALGDSAVESHVAGTPAYMAPEQCRGLVIDARADVYACGVVLYELATGRPPFDSDDTQTVIRQQVLEEPPPPSRWLPSIDPRLEAIILKALQKDPARRQSTMRDLRADLGGLRPQAAPATSARAEQLLARLEKGMRSMAAQSQSPLLRKVAAGMDARPSDPPQGAVARSESSKPPLSPMRAESAKIKLGPADVPSSDAVERAADEALTGNAARHEAAKAEVVHDGARGAHALCNARTRLGGDSIVRQRFVAIVAEIGAPAGPAVRATLESAVGASPVDEALLEDLLASLAAIRDEAAGHLVSALVGHANETTARAAVKALVLLWGARARPLLIGALDRAPDAVRVTALAALRRSGGFDDHVVRRLERILMRATPAGEELRVAAATCLGESAPATRAQAAETLMRVLAVPKAGVLSKLIGSGEDESPNVLLAAGRAALQLGVPEAHAAIQERASKSEEPLRAKLLELLR